MLIAKYGNGSIEQVEEFEKKYGINLDDCYRKFLIDYNGGETPNTILKKGKVSETVIISSVLEAADEIHFYNNALLEKVSGLCLPHREKGSSCDGCFDPLHNF